MIKKCHYSNGHQTACCLMIDDLVPAAVSSNNIIGPQNDWGYLMDQPNSLFHYVDTHLLSKFPEIRGTIFLPIESQNFIPIDNGYKVFIRPINSDFIDFLKTIDNRFEFAFHGIKHVYSNSKRGNTIYECENLSAEEKREILNHVSEFQKITGFQFTGGKFPGYRYNNVALDMIKEMNMNWWALDSDMINRRTARNALCHDEKNDVIYIPSNITGDIFKVELWIKKNIKKKFKKFLYPSKHLHPVDYIRYLYEKGFPITVQEHFQNQKPDGSRQKPNIFDDLASVEQIHSILRGTDTWYTTCGEIAHYFYSYQKSEVIDKHNGFFEIKYSGKKWKKLFLSIQADEPVIYNLDRKQKIMGLPKNKKWIFNNITPGLYSFKTPQNED